MTTTTPTPTPLAPSAPASTVAPVRVLGILSLVLGVASLAFGLFFIVPVAAIVLGVLALRAEPSSRAIAIGGIVTGAVSLAGFALAAVAALAFLPFLGIAASFGSFGWNW